MNYRWLLLDADGTLFDYDRAEAVALERTFRQLGHHFDTAYVEAYRRVNAEIWRQFEQGAISQERLRTRRFELLFAAIQVESDPVAFSARYLEHLAAGTDLIDGAAETVKSLYGKVGLILITNGLKEVQRPRVANSAVAAYLSGVVISEEVGASKPHGAIFDAAFRTMNDPGKEEVLMVGDSLTSDIRGGIAYGIDTCWFNPQRRPRPPDLDIRYEIQGLDELLGIVDAP